MNDKRELSSVNDATLMCQPAAVAAALPEDLLSEGTDADGKEWKKVALGTGAGIVLGVTGAYLLRGSEAEALAAEEAGQEAAQARVMIDNTVPVATGVTDGMPFQQAFETAREEVGSGGVFQWHGRLYNTFTLEEWDAMSAQERTAFGSHFDWLKEQSYPVEGHTAPASEEAAVPVTAVAEEPDVQVLGVYHDPDRDINVGGLTVDGHEVVVVDGDNDGVFDVAGADLNGDGEITEDEVADISARHLTVDDMGGFSDASDHAYTDGLDTYEV
ncbi:MAG: hypothetical protein LUI09_04955 [Prevotellaceae bacterium]|nr:hypothetical protein [Prevotellaceae bacterium]